MKKIVIRFILGQFLLLFPLIQIAKADCSISVTGNTSGNCWNMTMSRSCDGTNGDPLESCTMSMGGCDWGGISVFYMTEPACV
jgi:hypothetical protein